jgi:uncharacterized membrane protein YfcA
MIWSVLAGVLAGFVLGFIGAGGTVVALPVLLYAAKIRPHLTLGTNALGVSLIALALLSWRLRGHEVAVRDGITFALPGLIGIYFGAHLGLIYPGAKLVYLLGVLLFLVAAWIFYLSTRAQGTAPAESPRALPSSRGRSRLAVMAVTAFLVGLAAGFFAIGGGFMIVPGLMLAGGLELGLAARTALLPIAAFAGLVGIEYLAAGSVRTSWSLWMLLGGLIGGAAGIWLSDHLPLKTMQRAFAAFLVGTGIYMVLR